MARRPQWISDALPLVAAYDALARAVRGGRHGPSFVLDVTTTMAWSSWHSRLPRRRLVWRSA